MGLRESYLSLRDDAIYAENSISQATVPDSHKAAGLNSQAEKTLRRDPTDNGKLIRGATDSDWLATN